MIDKHILKEMKDFVYLYLTLEILIQSDEECSRYSWNEGLSERGSSDWIRRSMISLAYPKSVMHFIIWIAVLLIYVIVNIIRSILKVISLFLTKKWH